MKALLITAALFVSGLAHASSQINLPAGAVATIQPNESTVVSCEAVSSRTHFCTCGGIITGSAYTYPADTLIRSDIVGDKALGSIVGHYASDSMCHLALISKTEPACQ